MDQAISPQADLMVGELSAVPASGGSVAVSSTAPARASTMGNLDKVNYSHLDMIDYIIANPRVTQRDLAKRYGYTEGWISNVMASDAWKSQAAARRTELVDPVLHAAVEERFRMVTQRSLEKLAERLENPQVSDNTILKAVELGAKAMGVGGNAPPVAPPVDHLAQLANRLIDLQATVRKGVTLNGEASLVPSE